MRLRIGRTCAAVPGKGARPERYPPKIHLAVQTGGQVGLLAATLESNATLLDKLELNPYFPKSFGCFKLLIPHLAVLVNRIDFSRFLQICIRLFERFHPTLTESVKARRHEGKRTSEGMD
jgi:hypothetical protein